MTESDFLDAIAAAPNDELLRFAYADWLDDRGDGRAAFLRSQVALKTVAPDHPERLRQESDLSKLRKGLDPNWLIRVEPERAQVFDVSAQGPRCDCFKDRSGVEFHLEPQDTECDAWKRLLDKIEVAAARQHEQFDLRSGMEPADRNSIVTLPPAIGKLKAVRQLHLYRSHLVRIPREIGEMTSLESFDPYTSYRLHWYPYEITRCPELRDSRVSTRALYGNYKYHPPFPRLKRTSANGGNPAALRNCSVCDRPFEDRYNRRVWISLRVATDVLPLLVNACSAECVGQLPKPPEGYAQKPHRGGGGH